MTRFESNADDGEFFLPSRLFVTGFKVSLVECFLGCSFVPLCIAKIAGMVSFPGYKALFHRHKCFNRNGGVPSISFVRFVEKFRETSDISFRIIDIDEITLILHVDYIGNVRYVRTSRR